MVPVLPPLLDTFYFYWEIFFFSSALGTNILDIPFIWYILDIPIIWNILDIPFFWNILDIPFIWNILDIPLIWNILDIPFNWNILDIPFIWNILDNPFIWNILDIPFTVFWNILDLSFIWNIILVRNRYFLECFCCKHFTCFQILKILSFLIIINSHIILHVRVIDILV